MIRRTLRGLAVIAATTSVLPVVAAQQYQPDCAVPDGPQCAVPPVPYEPGCAVPAVCSTCAGPQQSCYQPQCDHCRPQHRGLFDRGLRPLFSWTKIHVENREECCQPASSCYPASQQAAAAAPAITFQPVQLQMTAYQPMMATQFVQAAPQFVATPQLVHAVPQVQQVMYRQNLAPQTPTDDCNLNNVCEKLAQLRDRVSSLEARLASDGITGDSGKGLEQRVADTEKAIRLQTDILDEIRNHLKAQHAE